MPEDGEVQRPRGAADVAATEFGVARVPGATSRLLVLAIAARLAHAREVILFKLSRRAELHEIVIARDNRGGAVAVSAGDGHARTPGGGVDRG